MKLKSLLNFYQYNFNNNHSLSQNTRSYFTNLFDNQIFVDKMRYNKIVIDKSYNLYKSYLFYRSVLNLPGVALCSKNATPDAKIFFCGILRFLRF